MYKHLILISKGRFYCTSKSKKFDQFRGCDGPSSGSPEKFWLSSAYVKTIPTEIPPGHKNWLNQGYSNKDAVIISSTPDLVWPGKTSHFLLFVKRHVHSFMFQPVFYNKTSPEKWMREKALSYTKEAELSILIVITKKWPFAANTWEIFTSLLQLQRYILSLQNIPKQDWRELFNSGAYYPLFIVVKSAEGRKISLSTLYCLQPTLQTLKSLSSTQAYLESRKRVGND